MNWLRSTKILSRMSALRRRNKLLRTSSIHPAPTRDCRNSDQRSSTAMLLRCEAKNSNSSLVAPKHDWSKRNNMYKNLMIHSTRHTTSIRCSKRSPNNSKNSKRITWNKLDLSLSNRYVVLLFYIFLIVYSWYLIFLLILTNSETKQTKRKLSKNMKNYLGQSNEISKINYDILNILHTSLSSNTKSQKHTKMNLIEVFYKSWSWDHLVVNVSWTK